MESESDWDGMKSDSNNNPKEKRSRHETEVMGILIVIPGLALSTRESRDCELHWLTLLDYDGWITR